jgi:hypothetical protein
MSARALRIVLVVGLSILFILSLAYFGYGNFQTGMPLMEVFATSLLLAVPLVLLYFSIGLMAEAWQQHRSQGRVSGRMAKFVYLTPRIAGLLVALFTGLFALDVFSEEGSIWMQIGAFLIHAAPSIIMILVLVLAWRYAWIGALFFGLAALFFLRFLLGGFENGFGNMLLFALPMASVAALFWLNWRWRGEIQAAAGAR